jgi:hypothetical protein
LSGKDELAKEDFNRAQDHAKHSSSLELLAKINLGSCAINNSIGVEDHCSSYKELRDLVDSKELDSYYFFIIKEIKKDQAKDLPKTYRDFAHSYLEGDYKSAIKYMFNIEKISSKLIAANMIKDKMGVEDVEKLLDEVSFYGYKKAVIHWLEILKGKDAQKSDKIDKKIKILES